ncbi:uncharacterized protein LOC130648706 [Hydractinia symbiolongicarpus]|uniref:uncharacterized protein LOC130648706 n=1 Tax=Hydractinia symbiolongicarpus TaxID=13093 RepID=UPI00254ED8E2|nr:uncharacterized protein LOC130648706 [Hydractinia symbiolongicarpus]
MPFFQAGQVYRNFQNQCQLAIAQKPFRVLTKMASRGGLALRNLVRFAVRTRAHNVTAHVIRPQMLSSISARSLYAISSHVNPNIIALQRSRQRFFASDQGSETIEEQTMNVLKLFDKVDPSKVTLEAHFINDLGLDSLDVVEVVMAFEDEFGIEISDEEAEKIFTVQQAVDLIKAKLDS